MSTMMGGLFLEGSRRILRKREFQASLSRTTIRKISDSGDQSLSSLLNRVQNGSLTAADAEKIMLQNSTAPSPQSPSSIESFANLDHDRSSRTGFPEAIFAAGKRPEQIASILDSMAEHANRRIRDGDSASSGPAHASMSILATRVDPSLFEKVAAYPLKHGTISYHEMARIVSMRASALDDATPDGTPLPPVPPKLKKRVVVACAGTTDMPVAEEAAITLESAGCEVDRVYDVGVAGLHRILNALPILQDPSVGCIVVCAGMDGALPSVVGGLVSVPVVAIPTSVGYGSAFGGVSALLTMLNSCAPGVGVVNIDNGFGGAALAFKIVSD